MNSSPSINDLREAFDALASSSADGVQGIHRITGAEPGPRAAISIMTHGNEPSGLAPYWNFLQNPELYTPERGELLFILNNLEAGQSYFNATTPEQKEKARFVDINMNRLPETIQDLAGDARKDIRRATELLPIFNTIDVALDIHSTTQESEPMIIQIKGVIDQLLKGVPIRKVIENIVPVQIGLPISSLYGGLENDIPVFEIETGSHENPASFQIAIRTALSFLLNVGLKKKALIKPTTSESQSFDCYKVTSPLIFPNETYELARPFPMFEPIKKDDVLANGNQGPLLSPQDGHAIFAPKKSKPMSVAEEVLFITDPRVSKNP